MVELWLQSFWGGFGDAKFDVHQWHLGLQQQRLSVQDGAERCRSPC